MAPESRHALMRECQSRCCRAMWVRLRSARRFCSAMKNVVRAVLRRVVLPDLLGRGLKAPELSGLDGGTGPGGGEWPACGVYSGAARTVHKERNLLAHARRRCTTSQGRLHRHDVRPENAELPGKKRKAFAGQVRRLCLPARGGQPGRGGRAAVHTSCAIRRSNGSPCADHQVPPEHRADGGNSSDG